ncbi:MAG: helix-turn-helix domain-containing protein [Alistipes sp.]|nr:helix-turn-helix domain-containing protein [Alistipes sp.]
MNSIFLDKKEPCIAELMRCMDRTIKALDSLGDSACPTFYGKRFMTDRELSAWLKISRRSLQEYRTAGILPYYFIYGKVLYCESEIEQLLEAGRRRTLDQMELL